MPESVPKLRENSMQIAAPGAFNICRGKLVCALQVKSNAQGRSELRPYIER